MPSRRATASTRSSARPRCCATDIPGLRVEIYRRGDLPARAGAALPTSSASTARIRFSDGLAPIEELLAAIASADVGVVAMRRNAFRELTHCNKMFDYIAMRRPAVVSRTRSVEAYFADSCFALFESGDEDDLARAIRSLHDDPQLGERLVARATEVSAPYRWVHQREIYRRAIAELAR